MHIQTCDVDIDEEVKQIGQSEPYIVATGQPGDENAQFFIACEQAILLESKSVQDALVDLIATYFVFDMAYPKSVSGILLFFQHVVFGIQDKQKSPPCLSKLMHNLSTLQ